MGIKKGKQILVLQKINSKTGKIEFEDGIGCIHTALIDISVEEFIELKNDVDAQKNLAKKNLNIRSSEFAKELELSIEEKFKAFKSWVAGIAEAGFESFKIQDEIDRNGKLIFPIASFLLRCLLRVDLSFINLFIERIERQCIFDGHLHISSYVANLNILFKLINTNIETIQIFPIFYKLIPIILGNYPNYLFTIKYWKIRSYTARHQEAPEYDEYKILFKDQNSKVRMEVAMNEKSTKFNEYKLLFGDEVNSVRVAVARNKNAVIYEEYKQLVKDNDSEIRRSVAANPNAINIPEYLDLFNDKDSSVRRSVAANPNATNIPEYVDLFYDKDSIVRCSVAANPNATNIPEYVDLFQDNNLEVRFELLKSSNARKFEEWKNLFIFFFEKFKHLKIGNERETMKEGENLFIASEYSRFLQKYASDAENVFSEEYKLLFEKNDTSLNCSIARNREATKLKEYSKLFSHEWFFVRASIASNPEATKCKEYENLFNDTHWRVRSAIFSNPKAKKFNAYKNLLNDAKVRELVTRINNRKKY